MALKFRKVKRPRRRKNPGAATTTLLISGGVIVAAALFIRHMINRPAPKAPLRIPTASGGGMVKPLDMSRPDAGQLEGLSGGGIFAGGF